MLLYPPFERIGLPLSKADFSRSCFKWIQLTISWGIWAMDEGGRVYVVGQKYKCSVVSCPFRHLAMSMLVNLLFKISSTENCEWKRAIPWINNKMNMLVYGILYFAWRHGWERQSWRFCWLVWQYIFRCSYLRLNSRTFRYGMCAYMNKVVHSSINKNQFMSYSCWHFVVRLLQDWFFWWSREVHWIWECFFHCYCIKQQLGGNEVTRWRILMM